MNDHGGKTPKKLKVKAEKPSGSVNWKALKRATEDAVLSPDLETTEDLLDEISAEEISASAPENLEPQEEQPQSESEEAPLKTVNWAAMKSLARELSATTGTEETEAEVVVPEVVETKAENIPAPTIEFGALQRAAAILRNNVETEPESEAETQQQEEESIEEVEDDDPENFDLRATLLQMSAELKTLRSDFKDLARSHCRLVEQGMVQDQVFNVMHAELQDYKTDFVHERFRPTVHTLLFLDDALEQFDREMKLAAVLEADDPRGTVPPEIVRENIAFFRSQLTEALAMCAVTPMETPQGTFDAHRQKAVKLIPVPAELDNTVQEVMRGGWYLKGQLLRPADVVVGKAD